MIPQNACIVVTGANGLAGSAVTDFLKSQLFTCVVGLGRADVDFRDREAVNAIFDRIQPAFVFHAAATVYGIAGNMANQYKSIFDNTMINTNVIDASRRVGVQKIIAMGTNATYPWPPNLPYREDDIFNGRPHHAEAGYAHAKRHMLALLEAAGIPYTYLVSGNLYGERDKFDPLNGHVLPSLIRKFYEASLNDHDTVNIWGDGSNSRDFLHSRDLARIVWYCLKDIGNNDPTLGAMNIGYGVRYTIEYIAKRLSGISGVDYGRVIYDTSAPKGRPDCYAELSRLKSIGFIPEVHIGAGLQRTYDWYRDSRASR
jgi:GDP-L-fucose synthase